MKKIKIPSWLPITDLLHILAILNTKGESRLVGGCVRDILMVRKSDDVDIATTILPEEVMALMQLNGIKCIPTGLKHGTVTALFKARSYEITTLRQDVNCDGRHAEVSFTDNWQQDARRRDFTINAMSLNIETGQLYDYFDGMKDLANKCIKFVGKPDERIREDYLRILRYFRFYAYLGGKNIDLPSLHACQKLAHGLANIAGERIQQEMFKLLTAPHAATALELLSSMDICPYLSLPNLPNIKKLIFVAEPIVNLAAVLRAANATISSVQKLSSHWHLSNHQAKLLHFLCQEHTLQITDTPQKHRAWLYCYGQKYYNYLLMLQNIEAPSPYYQERVKEAKNWVVPTLPINGNDLIELGLHGQELGNCLNHAKNCWIESDFKLQREELLKIILAKHFSI